MLPSLVALCIRVLAKYPDQIHALPVRLLLRPETARALIDDLVPDPADLDPCLWAALVQLYSPLPRFFDVCSLPLSDPILPLLQGIPSSHLFSLVTLLDLSATPSITDGSVSQLKFLHALTSLDVSGSSISSYGIRTLVSTLQLNEDEDSSRRHRGPWELRTLALRNCKRVNNDVYPELDKFPLLSIVDLRGTVCTRNASSPFKPCTNDNLYHPSSLRVALKTLQAMQPNLSASESPYIIAINKLRNYANPKKQQGRIGVQDSFVVIPSNPKSKITMGNTNVLEHQIQARDEHIKYENNKAAWYERQETIDEKRYQNATPKNTLRLPNQRTLAHFSKPHTHPFKSRALAPQPTSAITRSLSLSDVPPKVARGPMHGPSNVHFFSAPTTAAFTSIVSAGTATTSASVRSPHPPQQQHQASVRPHHSSTHLNQAIPVQRPPGAAPVTSAAQDLMARSGNGSISRGNTDLSHNIRRTTLTTAPQVTNALGHSNLVSEQSVGTLGRNSTSNTTAFYAAPQSTTVRRTTSASSLRSARPSISNPSSITKSNSSRTSNDTSGASLNLKLLRPPPPYAVLAEVIAREENARKQRQAERVDDTIPKKETNILSRPAVIDLEGVKAQKMKDAMEDALKRRIPPHDAMDGSERRQTMLSSSMSAAMFSFPDSPPSSSSRVSSSSTSKMRSMSSALAAFSASFNASSAASEDELPMASRTPNPFRKRVVSYPDMPSFGGSSTQRDESPTLKTSPKIVRSTKSIPKSAASSSKTLKCEQSIDKSKVSPFPESSSSKSIISVKDMHPRTDTLLNPKPLIPISAVKVPILPEDMRQEALRREAEELANMSRKRERAGNDSSEQDDDDDDDGVKKPKPALKKRAVKKGRTSTSSISSSKAKGKEKEKTKAFDWKGWGQKGGA